MEILEPTSLSVLLMAWALHEYQGRHQLTVLPPPEVAGVKPEEVPREALWFHLRACYPVILPMLAAHIKECLLVRLNPSDIPTLRVIGAADPLTRYSQNKLAEPAAGDGSADYVRRLAASGEPVTGPFVAIGRTVGGPFTLFDGMHRAVAWVAHVNAGRAYPLEQVYLVLTEWPSPAHELPEG